MKRARIIVDEQFKYKLEKIRVEQEHKENRSIPMVELTKKLDIMFPQQEFTHWKKNEKRRNELVF